MASDYVTAPGEPQPHLRLRTRSEVALLLKVADDTVDRLAQDGALRRVRIGSRVRFALEDVLDYVERSRSDGQ